MSSVAAGPDRSSAPVLNARAEAELFDASGSVRTDVPCRRCEYNLRGLPGAGRCPECGTLVALSTYGDFLRFSDPRWLETLARGVRFILIGLLLAILASFASGLLSATVDPVVGGVVGFMGSLLSVWGAWLVTERDPSGLGEAQYGRARRLIRMTLAVGLVGGAITILMPMLAPNPLMTMVLAVIAAVASLAGVIGEFAKLTYFAKLAQRIPDPKLARRARVLRVWYAGTLLVVLVGAGLTALTVVTATPALAGPGAAAAPGGPIAVGAYPPPAGGARPLTYGAPPGITPGSMPTGGAAGGGIGAGAPGIGGGPPPFATRGATGASLLVSVCLASVAGLALAIVSLFVLILQYRFGKAFKEQARLARAAWSSAEPGSA